MGLNDQAEKIRQAETWLKTEPVGSEKYEAALEHLEGPMDKNMRRSRDQELRIAQRFGGQVTPRSGAGWVKKGDVRTSFELFEAKTTAARSYSLKRDDLDLIEREALLAGKEWVFAIEIDGKDFVVLNEDYYYELTRGEVR